MRIKITKPGIFGAKGEIAVGEEFEIKGDPPKAWLGRYEVVGGSGKTAASGDANNVADKSNNGTANDQRGTDSGSLSTDTGTGGTGDGSNNGGGTVAKKFDAKHKGGPVWAVYEGETLVRDKLTKAQAEEFDKLATTEEQQAWLDAHPAPAE